MPITPVQYVNRPYVRSGTLGDLLRLRGQQQADAILRSGEIQARMWSDLGQNISGAINQYSQQRQDEPRRRQEQEARDLEIQSRRNEVEQQNRLTRQDTAFMALLEQQPNPDPREVMSIYGPQRGMAIAQGLHAFGELQQGAVKDARDTAGRLAMGMKALSPQLQTSMWPAVRQSAIKGGLGSEQEIPEQFTPEYLDAVIGWASGQMPKAAEGFTLSEGQTRFGPDGQPIANVPKPTEQPKNLDEAILFAERANNNPEVERLLGLKRRIAEAGRDPNSGAGAKFWVIRDGNPLRVSESEYRPGDLPANTREQGRPVTSGDAGRIADFDTSLDDVAVLRDAISGNKATGTSAYVGSKLPNWLTEFTGWGTDAKSKNAVIARVKQVIGKTLEGGVLRKEDEEKYKDILPIISDVPEVVAAKLEGLETAIRLRRQRFLESLSSADFDTSSFPAEYQPKRNTPDDSKMTPNLSGLGEGKLRRFTSGPYAGQEWTIVNGEARRVK